MPQKRLVSSNPAEAKMTRCTFASPGCAAVGITANPMSSNSSTDTARDIVGFIHVFCFIAPSCTVTSARGHYPSVHADGSWDRCTSTVGSVWDTYGFQKLLRANNLGQYL